jgi:tetratricopeptide (TPR) repeat protein
VPDNPRIEELRRRVQKDPASIAFAQLAEEHRRTGDYAEAARVCRAGLARHPSYLSARVTLGRALIELGQYEDAEAELEFVLRSAPENLAAIRGLGEIHQRRGNLTEALRQYQAALGLAKHDPELEESVHDLTRRLESEGSRSDPPPPLTAAEIAGIESHTPSRVAPQSGESATIPLSSLSPELEAAADEFTKALQALDALSLDLPAPEIVQGDVGSILNGDDASVEPEPQPELEPLMARLSGDDAMASELESWLDAIMRDREARAAKF